MTVYWSCSKHVETEKYQYKRNNIIQVKDKLVEIPTDSLMFSSHCRPYIIDNYLLIADYKSYDHLLHLLDKNTFRYITGFTYWGQGPGEIANMGTVGIDHSHRSFNVTDYGKQAMFRYNLDSVIANPDYVPERKVEIHADKIIRDYQYINDSSCIGLVLEPISSSDFKVATGILNTNNGEFTLMPYVHPKIKKKRACFDASLKHGLYVECYYKQNLMTICTLNGELKYNIYGGSNWTENQRGRFEYYQQAAFVKDRIFVLYLNDSAYINHPVMGLMGNMATKFLVFDLNGDYIATLETGYRIRYFCYDEGNNRIILNLDDGMQLAYLSLDGLIDS
jgi:hypothetical protein